MIPQRALQTDPTTPQQADGDTHLADQPRDLETFPDRLFAADMAAIYRLSLKRFYALASEGAFDFAVIKPRVSRQSWSRAIVRQHLAGELRGLTGTGRRRA